MSIAFKIKKKKRKRIEKEEKDVPEQILKKRRIQKFHLNYEILFRIFSFFPPLDFFYILQRVCKNWKDVQTKMPNFWKRIYGLYYRQTMNINVNKLLCENIDYIWKRRFKVRFRLQKNYGPGMTFGSILNIMKTSTYFIQNYQQQNHLRYLVNCNESYEGSMRETINRIRCNNFFQKSIILIHSFTQNGDSPLKWFLKYATFFVRKVNRDRRKTNDISEVELTLIGPNLSDVNISITLNVDVDEGYVEEDYSFIVESKGWTVCELTHFERKYDTQFKKKRMWNMLVDIGMDVNYQVFLRFCCYLIFSVTDGHKEPKVLYPDILKRCYSHIRAIKP